MNNDKKIKCIVWDLDNTLWNGVLLEDEEVHLHPKVVAIVKELDQRGILHSIASKNNYNDAMKKLRDFGIEEYFLYPQIGWNSKSSMIHEIIRKLNINLDSIAFVDDQDYEREEVAHTHPQVMTIPVEALDDLTNMREMQPKFITSDAKNRRMMYKQDDLRKTAELDYKGPANSFLRTLNMLLRIEPAREEDLRRVEELTMRTHQLNTTGYTFSYDQLAAMIDDQHYRLYVCSLDDKFGAYGKIGIVLIEIENNIWRIKLFLMSCRVMSRGIGTAVLIYLQNMTIREGVKLVADFIENERNKMMYVTYKMNGFKEILKNDNHILLEFTEQVEKQIPNYIQLIG